MTSNASLKRGYQSTSFSLEYLQLKTSWEDVICPICLDHPHNAVLLKCSSYDKGCRTFICDTDHAQSNCLERFKSSYGIAASVGASSTAMGMQGDQIELTSSNENSRPTCPLCRGDVSGWVIIDEARSRLNTKKRCCEEKSCIYVGNYLELQKHSQAKHPNARPSEIDPARKLDWENLQRSSETIDILSTIHAEVSRGVVSGDYVIEYGDDDIDTEDEYDDFPGDEGNWWTSCILYQVFDNYRGSRNRRRSRAEAARRASQRTSRDDFILDAGLATPVYATEFSYDSTDDELTGGDNAAATRSSSSHQSSWRRRLASNGIPHSV